MAWYSLSNSEIAQDTRILQDIPHIIEETYTICMLLNFKLSSHSMHRSRVKRPDPPQKIQKMRSSEEQWGAVRCSEVQKTENDKKSIFSYIDMIYIIVKLMTCGLRICICFWAWGSFQPLEHVLENGPEKWFFYFFQIICFWKAHNLCFKNL